MIKLFKITCCILLTFFACSNLSIGQEATEPRNSELSMEGPKGPPPSFKKLLSQMDKNKDGKLELLEVQGPLKKDFKRVDINEDGYITEEELKKAGPPHKRKPKG